MSKINRVLTEIEEYYLQQLPEKQFFFKEEFKKFFKCSDSTFFRRLRIGNRIDDLKLFEYIFSIKVFENQEKTKSKFINSNVKKFELSKNQIEEIEYQNFL